MRVCFCTSDKPRERLLADAFARGAMAHGDDAVVRPLEADKQIVPDIDVAAMVGVKSRELYRAYWNAGVHVIMIDKGYTRHSGNGPVRLWEYWRVAVDGHHPTRYLMDVARPSDRFDRLSLEVKPWREAGDQIVFAGSSQKYHDFYSLRDPTEFARKIIRQTRSLQPEREVIYRPKPSWQDAVPIKGSTFSKGKSSIYDVLDGAHALITHGSNACFEAMLLGVPSVILGDAVAKPISSTTIDEIAAPRLAPETERQQLLWNLAYSQWTLTEFTSGEAWNVIRPQILR